MAILTPDQRAALAARLALPDCAGLSDPAAADLLNAPGTATATIPAPFAAPEIMGAIGPVSLAKVYTRPGIVRFADDVRDQDRAAVANWIALALIAGDVQQSERDAAMAVIAATRQATVPAPSWAATAFPDAKFPLPDGGVLEHMVTSDMIAEARP